MKKRILISAGESSGDLHGANLIKELKKLNPNLEFFGIGCDKMENQGVTLLERMDKLSIIGVWEIFANLKFIRNLFKKFDNEIKNKKIDLAVLIDYPGFNLILAKKLKEKNIPCIYYVTPQFWAWGKWRVKKFKKYVKKALTIFKFEEEFFKKEGIDAQFVGHPLLDEMPDIKPPNEAKKNLGLDPEKFTIALMPGSRKLEVERMLPVMLKTAELIKKEKDIQYIASKSLNVDESIYDKICKNSGIKFIKGGVHAILNASDFVLTSSGTVTLQIALSEKPMVIIYITSFFTALLGKIFIRTPFIGLANIVSKKLIVPEVLQYDANPKNLSRIITDIISSDEKMKRVKNNLGNLKSLLGTSGASKRAAEIISKTLRQAQV